MKVINKKILSKYFEDINKSKFFEIRKDDDNIQIGDVVKFMEWDGENYTGMYCAVKVIYVLRNVPEYGLKDGYCIFCWGEKPRKMCVDYFGIACIDGTCPIANIDEYIERDYDVVRECYDCPYYRGCEYCYWYREDQCKYRNIVHHGKENRHENTCASRNPYRVWCRKLVCYVRAHANRCRCKHRKKKLFY